MIFYVKGEEVKLQGFLGFLEDIGYKVKNADNKGSVSVMTENKKADRLNHVVASDYDVEKDAFRIEELLNVKNLNFQDEDLDFWNPCFNNPSFTYDGVYYQLNDNTGNAVDIADGKKETKNKTQYKELDWDYIDGMSNRMSGNREKYPPENWKKRMDIKELAESAMRHARKILQEIDNDPETLKDHAVALGCNGMMINYQLK